MATYLITGCSRGISLEMVSQLSKSGSAKQIFATSRTLTPALEAHTASSPGKVIFVPLDVSSESSIASAKAAVSKHLNGAGIDILINNAGVMSSFGPTKTISTAELTSIFVTNVSSVHSVTQAFLPILQAGKDKKIVNISSSFGSITLNANNDPWNMAPCAAYKVSKAALNMLTVQWASNLASEGFVVFAVSPGWLKTDLGGPDASLEVNVGVEQVLQIVKDAKKEDNATFKDLTIKEMEGGYNGSLPW